MQRKLLIAGIAMILSGCAQLGGNAPTANVAKPQKAVVKESLAVTPPTTPDVNNTNPMNAVVVPAPTKTPTTTGTTAIAPPPPPKPAESVPATSSSQTSPRGYSVTAPPPSSFGGYSDNHNTAAPQVKQDPRSDVSGFEQNVLSRKKGAQFDALRFDDSVTAANSLGILTDGHIKNGEESDPNHPKKRLHPKGPDSQDQEQEQDHAAKPKDHMKKVPKDDHAKKPDKEFLKPQPHVMKV